MAAAASTTLFSCAAPRRTAFLGSSVSRSAIATPTSLRLQSSSRRRSPTGVRAELNPSVVISLSTGLSLFLGRFVFFIFQRENVAKQGLPEQNGVTHFEAGDIRACEYAGILKSNYPGFFFKRALYNYLFTKKRSFFLNNKEMKLFSATADVRLMPAAAVVLHGNVVRVIHDIIVVHQDDDNNVVHPDDDNNVVYQTDDIIVVYIKEPTLLRPVARSPLPGTSPNFLLLLSLSRISSSSVSRLLLDGKLLLDCCLSI